MLCARGYEALGSAEHPPRDLEQDGALARRDPVAAITGLSLDVLTNDRAGFAVMAGVLREANAIGRRLGFELADDVEERLGFYRDKPARPSLLKDFELGREPELASGVLVFDLLAKAMDVDAPHIFTVAALTRLRWLAVRGGAHSAKVMGSAIATL